MNGKYLGPHLKFIVTMWIRFDPFSCLLFHISGEFKHYEIDKLNWTSFLQLQLGLLVPLEEIDGLGTSGRNITLFEGYNSIGRNDLAITSKHVSRKHISIHASNDGTFRVTVVNILSFLQFEKLSFTIY